MRIVVGVFSEVRVCFSSFNSGFRVSCFVFKDIMIGVETQYPIIEVSKFSLCQTCKFVICCRSLICVPDTAVYPRFTTHNLLQENTPNSCLFNACTAVDWFCVIKIQSYRYVLMLCKTSCVQSDVVLSGDENRVGNYDEASIRYRGNHIPSPSFRLLQTLAKEDEMKNKTGSRK